MRYIKTSVIAALFTQACWAQGTPPGTQGQDWDMKTINIKNNVEVVINGQVTTKNTKSGNTSSIILFINETEVRRNGGERAQSTVTYRFSENGRHNIKVVCSNSRADADTCLLNIARSKVIDFE